MMKEIKYKGFSIIWTKRAGWYVLGRDDSFINNAKTQKHAKEIIDVLERKKNPPRKRKKNPPLVQPFKVVIGAVAKRGHKTMMWFDGKHFRTTKVKRAMFSSIHNAKIMALSLIKRFPVLSKYTVGVYRAS